MFRITRLRLAIVLAVVLGAIFVDGFALIYRLTVNEWFPKPLTSIPNIAGKQIYLPRGLDLQGGTELVIAVCRGNNDPPAVGCRNGPPPGHSVTEARDGTIKILEQRVNALGVSESPVQSQGSDQILVTLPGIGLKQAIDTIGTTAKLHFATPVPGAANPSDPNFIADQQNLFDINQLSDGNSYPPGYHWKIDPNIDASDVNMADAGTDQNGQPSVNINFNGHGATEWSKITTTAFQAYSSSPQNPPATAKVAIFLDNKVLTAPNVISGGQTNNTQITGNFTTQTATLLASEISAGALPAEIGTVSTTEVSATLGQHSVTASLIAGAVGLLIVILFMIGYYRFPGVLATAALFVYALIVLAVFKLFPVTMTLAGLAGFVLSVGMAVDANVLIFERTRDELRHGRGVAVAVETGFRRAFPAIRDSNISTLIATILLAYFGSSVVRGFAITLMIGVIVSFFSAIYLTRSLFAAALRWRVGRNPSLYTEIHEEYTEQPPRGRFDIVRARNWYFAGSLVIIIPGILAIIFWGFRLGIDFAGGNRIDVALQGHHSQNQVQLAATAAAGDLRPTVESASNGHFLINTLPAGIDRVIKLDDALDKQFGIAKDRSGKPQVQVQQVGPSIASSLVTNAVILILLSAASIAVYLAFAFRRQRAISPWRFSMCTFLKLLHDVFVLLGIWAILGKFSELGQVDSLFVTALLTSVAFSIHDTIVVFDRVRENLRVGPRLTFDQIINLSTVQTMTRSLNTSLTVVFVLLSLVLFGGESIRGFVLALLIGIVTGTYSSIFNASTLLVAWEKVRGHSTGKPTGGPRRVQTRAAA